MIRLLRRCCLVVALLVLASGCGLAADESPRVISADTLPDELQLGQLPTTSSQGPGAEQVHLVQNGRLVTVERQIVSTPQELMEILFQSTFPVERAEGIRSAIDSRAEVQNIEVAALSNVAIVDLAPGSLDPDNDERKIAFAQIVFTLTSLAEIEAVQFVQTDPADPAAGTVGLNVQTDTGSTLPGAAVTRANFARLSPTPQVGQPAFDIPVAEPTPTPDPNAFDLPVWMLDGNNRLITVSRNIERTADALLNALIDGVGVEEREALLRSALPLDALADPVTIVEIESTQFESTGAATVTTTNRAIVDLTPGSLPSVADGNERYLAAAQIVYTLTGLEEIDEVTFVVDGIPFAIPTDRGVTDPNINRGLERSDYINALSDIEQQLVTPTPTPLPTPTPATTEDPEPAPEPTPGG